MAGGSLWEGAEGIALRPPGLATSGDDGVTMEHSGFGDRAWWDGACVESSVTFRATGPTGGGEGANGSSSWLWKPNTWYFPGAPRLVWLGKKGYVIEDMSPHRPAQPERPRFVHVAGDSCCCC